MTERLTDAERRLMEEARADAKWRYMGDDPHGRGRIYEVRAVLQPRRDDPDRGIRVAAYLVLCAMFVVAGVLVVAVWWLLGQ